MKMLGHYEYPEDNEASFQLYDSGMLEDDSLFEIKVTTFSKFGEKELIKERFLKALKQVKEKIEQTISEVESTEI